MIPQTFWKFIAEGLQSMVRGAVLYGKIPVTIGLKKVVQLLSKYLGNFI